MPALHRHSGIDLVSIERITKVYYRHTDRFLKRAFHPQEIAAFQLKFQASVPQAFQYLSSRWAVKEALIKAFGYYRLDFREIETLPSSHVLAFPADFPVQKLPPRMASARPPVVQLHGSVKALAQYLKVPTVLEHVDISHDQEYAIASVVLTKERNHEPF